MNLVAREGIRFESMKSVTVQGLLDIMALPLGGASALCVNGNVDMFGRQTCLCGSGYQTHEKNDDVPKEGEFDWAGVARNIAGDMEIINSSSQPNSNIDMLLSGFEKWLKRQ